MSGSARRNTGRMDSYLTSSIFLCFKIMLHMVQYYLKYPLSYHPESPVHMEFINAKSRYTVPAFLFVYGEG